MTTDACNQGWEAVEAKTEAIDAFVNVATDMCELMRLQQQWRVNDDSVSSTSPEFMTPELIDAFFVFCLTAAAGAGRGGGDAAAAGVCVCVSVCVCVYVCVRTDNW